MQRSRRPREKARVTIKDVAQKAGVSAMTVSNVFNGTGKFSRETRDRVMAAIAALGYVPSSAARRLVGQHLQAEGDVIDAHVAERLRLFLHAAVLVAEHVGAGAAECDFANGQFSSPFSFKIFSITKREC